MKVAVTGYASLDHVALLDGQPSAGRTTTMLDRPTGAWPRLGGSPAYVAAALAANGVPRPIPVSWVGDDPGGADYVRQLREQGLPVDGIAIIPGGRTAAAVLAYEPSGDCICLYDPGRPRPQDLSAAQRALVAGADWLCVTIGPPAATGGALDAIGGGKVAWVVKNDPRAMPQVLARQLAARADIVIYSHAEAAFVAGCGTAEADRAQIRIETRGRAGATLVRDGRAVEVPTEALAVADATGAGDTFAGGALAALVLGETDPRTIVRAGHDAARALLLTRETERYSA